MDIDHAALHQVVNVEGQTCFGCGDGNPLGLHMQFRSDGQRLYSFVTVPGAMAGWDTTVHGGIISTILDEIMGWSVIYLLGKIGVTRTMTVDFLKPLHVGKQLSVIGTIGEICSDRQVVATGEIFGDDESLCARAKGTFATLSPQTAVRLGVMSPEYLERFMPVLEQRKSTT